MFAPAVVCGITVGPPLVAHLQVGCLRSDIPCVLDGDLSLDGLEAFDGRGDGVVEGSCVVGAVAQHIEAVALVVALPLLFADIEGDAGRVDGNILAIGTLQLPLDDATYLGGVLCGGGAMKDGAGCAVGVIVSVNVTFCENGEMFVY